MPVINFAVTLVCVVVGAGYYWYGNISLCCCLVPVINVVVTLVCVVAWCQLFTLL